VLNALSGNTASGRSGPNMWQRVLYPHSPFGHVARLAGTRGLRHQCARPDHL